MPKTWTIKSFDRNDQFMDDPIHVETFFQPIEAIERLSKRSEEGFLIQVEEGHSVVVSDD